MPEFQNFDIVLWLLAADQGVGSKMRRGCDGFECQSDFDSNGLPSCLALALSSEVCDNGWNPCDFTYLVSPGSVQMAIVQTQIGPRPRAAALELLDKIFKERAEYRGPQPTVTEKVFRLIYQEVLASQKDETHQSSQHFPPSTAFQLNLPSPNFIQLKLH